MIVDKDDLFHQRNDDPLWNESAWFSIMVPEKNLCGWVYFYHRPNMNYTVGGVALWDPSGEEAYNCRFHNWGDTFPFRDGFEMHDFSLPNGLTVSTLELQKSYRFRMKNGAIDLDLTWSSFMPPFESGFPGGGTEKWGSRHYEQGGRMAGRILLDNAEYSVDCWSNRDRSWGPRKVVTDEYPRSGFAWAIASATHAFTVFPTSTLLGKDDPVIGATDKIICGWYIRDGLTGEIKDGARRVTERGPDGRPLRTVITATDEHGRQLEAAGTCANWINWHGYPFLFMWWSLAKWTFDGVTAWGEEQDFYPQQHARRFIRSLPKK